LLEDGNDVIPSETRNLGAGIGVRNGNGYPPFLGTI
jgi:hypothetical protein